MFLYITQVLFITHPFTTTPPPLKNQIAFYTVYVILHGHSSFLISIQTCDVLSISWKSARRLDIFVFET